MKLILTRHGETEENREGILQGWLPGHLSNNGKNQAQLLGERLRNTKIDYIYTSDLKRCVETANEIAKYHPDAKFVKEKLLRERGLGEFEGKKTGEADWEALSGDFFTNKPSAGESFGEVWIRLEKFYGKISNKHIEDTVLIVGHGGSVCLLQGLIYGNKLQESMKLEKLKNTAISEFEISKNGEYKVISLNCDQHI
jgi:broad specificity phosphatase PhoE